MESEPNLDFIIIPIPWHIAGMAYLSLNENLERRKCTNDSLRLSKPTMATTATRKSSNRRFNQQNNNCACAL